ncbi:MAG: class I SAM-dependent methyltransferase [Anaerolineae bacterium]|nr:class I SAM-dependent methyltransferase [Anaerolineae bacterium]
MDSKLHWESIYNTKATDQVSWYQQYPQLSMTLIRNAGIDPDTSIIDVGAGASVLVDSLLDAGYTNLTILDISHKAQQITQQRLADRAVLINWLEADVTQVDLPANSFGLWHDRAVFHFLKQPEQRQAYLATLRHALKPDGQAIIATFAVDGPTHCSNLEVMRYSAESLSDQLGSAFKLLEAVDETHHTPFETEQKFVYCRFIRS